MNEIIEAGGVLSVNSVGLIAHQILSGLQFINKHCMTLGDFGPANVVLCLDQLHEHRIQLVDIGLRRFFISSLDPSMRPYLAPEVGSGSKYGPKADMWSLGAIVYRLLTPKSSNEDLLAAQHGDLDLSRTIGSADVIRTLKRLLSLNPSRRYQPADALRVDFIARADPRRRFELHFQRPLSRSEYDTFLPMTTTTTTTTTTAGGGAAKGGGNAVECAG